MTRTRSTRRWDFRAVAGLILLSATIAIFAWSCGADDDATATATSAGTQTTVIAKDTKFSPGSITIKSGEEVTVELQNNDPIEHDFQVDDLDIDVTAGGIGMGEHGEGGHSGGMLAMHAAAHESMSITFTANERGTYAFYCTIPGHKESGMAGTLTVQ